MVINLISTVRTIIGTFSFVLLFILGLDWLFESTIAKGVFPHLDRWPGLKTLPLDGRVALASSALLMPLAFASLYLAEGMLKKGIKVTSAGGTDIVLRPEAIERPLNRDVWAAVDSVLKVESEAFQARNGAGVVLFLTLSDKAEVDDAQAAVRETAASTLRRITGSADGANIKVVVRDVKPSNRGGAGGKKLAKRPEKARKPAAARSS